MLPSTHHHEHRHAHRNSAIKLSVRSLAIATGIITALVYTICVLFIAIAPQPTMAFFSYVLHTELSGLTRVVTLGSFIVGLLFWSWGTAIYAAAIAGLYNGIAPRP